MILKWQLSEHAVSDMKNIRAFTKREWGAEQSALYIRKIVAKIEILAQNPHIGIDRSDEYGGNVRSAIVGSHTIYYEHDAEFLTIHAVLHQAMTPDSHLQLTVKEYKSPLSCT
jgi:plasmid stabilization system protein ParE